MTPEELALETGVQQEKKSVSQETARLELPDRCMVAPMGFQVRLRLVFTGREGMPNLYLISDSYDLYYQKAEISAGENNTDICTVLEQGASGLPDGETMSFEVSNVSTFDGGTVEGYCYLMAYGGAGEAQKIRLTEDLPFSVGYGEKVSFSINSWDSQIELSGSYDIRVYMTAGKYETFRWLSRLKVRERQGLHVTIGEDEMDAYDGETSLREAIAWYMEGKCAGEAITFAECLYEEGVSLDAPLLIDGSVVINGIRYLGEDGPFGIALEMENTVPGFEISEKGSLIMKGISVIFAENTERKGVGIINDGGSVELDHCRFYGCAGEGGTIYANGGKLRISNTTFKYNIGLNGGILYIEGGADVSMLNCLAFWNEAEENLITNIDGSLHIVNCTFADNEVNQSTIYSEKGAGTRLLNSICLMNGGSELKGSMNVYASQIGEVKEGCLNEKDISSDTPVSEINDRIILDRYTKVGTDPKKFYRISSSNSLLMTYYASSEDGIDCIHYLSSFNAKAPAGVQVFEKDGKLFYVTKKLKIVMTDVTADFAEEMYRLDEIEENRGFSCGSQSYDRDTVLYSYTNCQGETVYTMDAEKDGTVEKHRFGKWQTVLEAGEHTSGVEEKICEVCGYKKTREIPPLSGAEEIPETNPSEPAGGGTGWIDAVLWYQQQVLDIVFRWIWG